MKKENNNLKREYLRKKQLELLARGIEVYQNQLDENYTPTDKVVLEQLQALKELCRIKTSQNICQDISELQTNPNQICIKKFFEENIQIRNNEEEQMMNRLYFLELLSSVSLTKKQYQVLDSYLSGYSTLNIHKQLALIFKKLQKVDDKMKQALTEEQLKKLFPTYFKRNSDIPEYDNYLNAYERLPIYEKDVQQSKQRGDYFRQLSLQYSILPYPFNEEQL